MSKPSPKLSGTAQQRLAKQLQNLPQEPGVYIMRDALGQVLYVGKAINLRARVRSYFRSGGDGRAFILLLDGILSDIEISLVSDERAALLLENKLIKKLQPRFNSMLRDDKNFLSLRIDVSADPHKDSTSKALRFPRLSVTRRIRNDGARYFGPYTSAQSLRQTLKLVNHHFGLRSCSDRSLNARRRPCILYQMGRCAAPCTEQVEVADYRKRVDDLLLFLGGRSDELVKILQQRMQQASEQLDYERAARLRDQIRALQRVVGDPQARQGKLVDRDFVGFARRGPNAVLAVATQRDKSLGQPQIFRLTDVVVEDVELLSSLLSQYYHKVADVDLPQELLLPMALTDGAALQMWLSERRKSIDARRSLKLLWPRRGAARSLLDAVQKNAGLALEELSRRQDQAQQSVVSLQKLLRLQTLPRSIECFDVSTTQGQSAVASKVRFVDAAPDKKGYRRFIIKKVDGQDDYAMLYEALTRRLKRGLQDKDIPDLLLVDGGKGQLAVAMQACRDLQIRDLQLAGIAKARLDALDKRGDDVSQRSEERIFLPHVRDAIPLKKHSLERALVERVRDEAHRFAITFHRQRRGKKSLGSALDAVAGVGPVLRKRLLRHFGSMRALRQASVGQIVEVRGVSKDLAQRLHTALQS